MTIIGGPRVRRTITTLTIAALTTGALAACASGGDVAAPAASSPSVTTQATPTEASATPTPTPSPTPTRVPGTYMIGETSEPFVGGVLTLNSVEVVKEIATTDGDPLVAAAGEQLVLFRTHFTNTGTGTVDLSCSGVPDWYMQVFDTEDRELAPVFEMSRIPGNPECNHQMLSGQSADWTFAYRGIEGATPRVLQIEDSRTFEDFIGFSLTDEPLTLK